MLVGKCGLFPSRNCGDYQFTDWVLWRAPVSRSRAKRGHFHSKCGRARRRIAMTCGGVSQPFSRARAYARTPHGGSASHRLRNSAFRDPAGTARLRRCWNHRGCSRRRFRKSEWLRGSQWQFACSNSGACSACARARSGPDVRVSRRGSRERGVDEGRRRDSTDPRAPPPTTSSGTSAVASKLVSARSTHAPRTHGTRATAPRGRRHGRSRGPVAHCHLPA